MTNRYYDRFWAIIDAAHGDSDALVPLISTMSREDLLELYRDFRDLARDLREPPFVDRGTDYYEELTWYAVGLGRAAYESILAHPETFPEHLERKGRGFMGVISSVFWERFDEEIQEADANDPP